MSGSEKKEVRIDVQGLPVKESGPSLAPKKKSAVNRISTQHSLMRMNAVTKSTDMNEEEKEDLLSLWLEKHTPGDAPPTNLTWTRKLGDAFAPHQEFQVSTAEGLRLAGLGYRMYKYIQKETQQGRIPIMNPFKKSAAGPRMGVPVGGFGSGTINRGWRGDWGRNYLFQGFPNYNIVDINGFSVSTSLKEDGSDGSGTVMTYGKPDNNKDMAKTWKYNLNGDTSYYQGLYPRAWTTYEEPGSNLSLTCRQMSPVIPGNYKETSFPVGTFVWQVENYGSVPKYVNIMFSFLNGTGDPNDSQGGHFNRHFTRTIEGVGEVEGVALHHQARPNERIQRILKDLGKADAAKAAALKMLKAKDVGEDEDDSLTASTDVTDEDLKKLVLTSGGPADPLVLGIAVLKDSDDMEVSYETNLICNDRKSLGKVWDRFEKSTRLSCTPDISQPTAKGQEVAACIMVRVRVPAQSKRNVTFTLGWDMPIVRFNSGRGYYRRYTKWYGRDGNAVEKLLCDALENDAGLEQQIDEWQCEILGDRNLPDWYKQALFNELYYLAEGGSVWTDGEIGKEDGPTTPNGEPGGRRRRPTDPGFRPPAKESNRMTMVAGADSASPVLGPYMGDISPGLTLNFSRQAQEQRRAGKENPEVDTEQYIESYVKDDEGDLDCDEAYEHLGQFGYLESMEYLMVNTYDVHFYASWALIQNWPLLDLTIQRDFAKSTLYDDYDIVWKTLHSGKRARRKVKYAVPHDLGNPGDDPWYKVNSYNIQEINSWKDLNCKFALQVWRDYQVTKNKKFLFECWEAVEEGLKYVSRFDKDGDGLIENEGFPDQTYDTWSALGASAYSGGLWLAAVSSAAAMCREMNMEGKAQRYDELLKRAKESYHDKLWNGTYFNYDTSDNPQHDSIMADMCCGQWWARACGLDPIDAPECFQSSLSTIHKFNVKKFRNGECGPMNGMRPDGKIDQTCLQSVEVWTGTAYGAAAAMMQEGLLVEGFETAYGIANVTYNTVGYMYQTPEAWDSQCHYRAIGYMRPLAIWGMQYAWKNLVTQEQKEKFGRGELKTFADTEQERQIKLLQQGGGGMGVMARAAQSQLRPVRKDVVAWCVKELKLPDDVAHDYEARLATALGVACVDDLRWLIEEDMDTLEIPTVHKRKIMTWASKNKP